MSPICSLKKQDGIVLVGVVGLMIFLGLFAAVGVSVLSTSTFSHEHLMKGSQALGLAHAGSEWYLEQLQNDTDWTNETTLTRNLGNGSFTITINGTPTATEVQFTSTGTVTSGVSGIDVQRVVSMTAQKLPKAFRFAIYQGFDPGGPTLSLTNQGGNNTEVIGDVWSRGSVSINGSNSVTGGSVYVPDTESVSGGGTYTDVQVSAPYPSMPTMDTSSLVAEMSGYDTQLDSGSLTGNFSISTGTFNINTHPSCSGGVCEFRTFETTGNVTITGNGYIVVDRDIDLHGNNGLGGGTSLTVSPSGGGSIVFMTNRSITVGSNNDNPDIDFSGDVTLYSRSESNNNRLIRIRGANTTLTGTRLLAQRRIIIEDGADLLSDSLAFVNYPGNNTNNTLDVVGDNDITTFDGTLISLGRSNTALRVRNGSATKQEVVVTGLVYSYGTSSQGRCDIDQATITGAVVCGLYASNNIRNCAITQSTAALPDNIPGGFDGFVSVEPNSWDGI